LLKKALKPVLILLQNSKKQGLHNAQVLIDLTLTLLNCPAWMYLPTVCTWQDVTLQLITLCAMATQTQLLVYVTTQLPLASLQNKCTHPSCPVTVLLRKHKIYQKTQIA